MENNFVFVKKKKKNKGHKGHAKMEKCRSIYQTKFKNHLFVQYGTCTYIL